jgi:PAS domain S-box-containing protein
VPEPSTPFPEDTFRRIAEQASDGIFVTDEDLRIEWVNARACQLLRMPKERLRGQRISDLFWTPVAAEDESLRSVDLLAGKSTMTVRNFRAGDGSRLVLEVSARSIGSGRFVGIARDATARLESQAKVARSEASFRALIEGSPDGVVVHRDERLVYANARFARLLGWPDAESMLGLRVIELVHPDDRAMVRERMRVLGDEDAIPYNEERLLRRDGSVVTCSIGGVNVVFEGEPSVAVIARDVTEQRAIQAQLAAADRMASLGALAAGVAHEINNPLTFVLLRLDAIAAQLDALRSGSMSAAGLDELASHLAVARDGADRVKRIVGDLRVFSRSYEDVHEAIDPRVPLELAIGMAAHEVKHRARLVREFADVPRVMASEGRLAQVFVNLLLNAAQALPETDPEGHEIRVRTRAEDGDVVVEIEDTGPGIAAEHLAHIFEPFFTTKPVGIGTGLGLSICHGIITGLGGTIRLENGPIGTRAVVRLPATDVRPSVPAAPPSRSEDRKQGRVLVVDDEVAIGRALAEGLSRFAEVIAVDGGAKARALLERGESFDAILCDVRMPGVSGPDLYAWIAHERPELAARFVFMTGGRIGEKERALADDERLVEKPFDLDTIEARLRRLVGA